MDHNFNYPDCSAQSAQTQKIEVGLYLHTWCESIHYGQFFFLQVSDGGVHAHINHLESMIDAAKELGVPKCYVQFFADGRDTSPTSGGIRYIEGSYFTTMLSNSN